MMYDIEVCLQTRYATIKVQGKQRGEGKKSDSPRHMLAIKRDEESIKRGIFYHKYTGTNLRVGTVGLRPRDQNKSCKESRFWGGSQKYYILGDLHLSEVWGLCRRLWLQGGGSYE